MSVIYAAPGAAFESTAESETTGLTGTIGARIVDGQGATTVARATTGIVETPAGSGVYVATLTAPTVQGSYTVVWDTGGGAPSWGTDTLVVTTDGVLAATTRSGEGIVVARGQLFESTLDNADTGLTGTLGVRIVDGHGNTTVARSTAGIVETPAGSGVYVATLTAPTVGGQYAVVWDTGGSTPEYAADPLTVTPGADLTTLAAVRAHLQLPDVDIDSDAELSALISRASAVIQRWTGREFAPPTSAETRVFTYPGRGRLELAPYEARAVTAVVLDSQPGGQQITLSTTDYALRPLPARDGVYQWLELAPYRRCRGGQVSVTGDWGWPTVPDDVEHACIVTVATWMRRDVAAYSRVFNLDESRIERPQALPSAVMDMLDLYRAVPVG